MVEGRQDAELLSEPEAAAVHEALARILASDAFRSAPQLSAFLNFIVERSLEGRSSELKGYTIAVEAFGRPPDFDPQSDPIVRVEAGRLRKALGQYYQGDGASDPIRISIPVGAYVPLFERVAQDASEPERGSEPAESAPHDIHPAPLAEPGRRKPSRLRHWAAVAVLAILMLPLATWYRFSGLDPVPSVERPSQQARLIEEAARRAASSTPAHLPTVVVAVSGIADDPEIAGRLQRYTRFLIDAMVRFDDLVSVKTPAAGADPHSGADFVFEMNVGRQGDKSESFGRLRSVKDGRVVWATSSVRPLPTGGDDEGQRERARNLAVRLAEPFGIIHSAYRQRGASSPMSCIFLALSARRTMRAEDHLAARTCLEGVLDQDPAFHPAWSHLALLTLEEYTSGFNPLSGAPLDRALAAALTAVRLAPSSARAQQALMNVHFARGADEDAAKAGQAALTLNPWDPDIMADLGAHFVQSGRSAEGLPLLRRAVDLSSGRPPWYDFFTFLGAYLTGETALAETSAAVFVADESPLSLLGRALQAVSKQDEPSSSRALQRLIQIAPLFALDARLYLQRQGFRPVVVDRIIADLGPRRLQEHGIR